MHPSPPCHIDSTYQYIKQVITCLLLAVHARTHRSAIEQQVGPSIHAHTYSNLVMLLFHRPPDRRLTVLTTATPVWV